jgi:hypothetical protein
MKVYRRKTEQIIKRFLSHQISFPECIAALDAGWLERCPI